MKICHGTSSSLVMMVFAVLWMALHPRPIFAQVDDLGASAENGVHVSTLTLPAQQDATVRSNQPNVNYGGEATLSVASETTVARFFSESLLQFDFSALPQGTTIDKAVLHLHQQKAAGALWQMNTMLLGDAWKESGVTWNTRPPFSDAIPAIVFDSPNTDNVMIDVDLTSFVKGWFNAPTNTPNYGLLIRGNPQQTLSQSRVFASREGKPAPTLEITYTLPPIRVCLEVAEPCKAVVGAIVHDLDGAVYSTDSNGYLPLSNTIGLGHRLWVRAANGGQYRGALYLTNGERVLVTADQFSLYRVREMRIPVSSAHPLWVQDLDVSAQWWVQGDAQMEQWLTSQLIAASNALYAFTDGQFALGAITVRQSYDGWDDVHLRLHSSNVFRPRAVIGGIVPSETPDVAPTIPISYTPGQIFMGSYWNRFGSPPNQVNISNGKVVTQDEMAGDWALALAHEIGHYLLFQFDTYTGIDGKSDANLAELCTGSAMGDVYKPSNQGFIFDQTHWDQKCSLTEAYARLRGRNEWATINAWYPWVNRPTAFVAGPPAPPVQVTSVKFVAPSTPPGPLASQIFNLGYQDNETSSGEARAFLTRAGRIFEQGKPAKATTQVQLTDAQIGDRLCVYDVDDRAVDAEAPRHQFGCETLVAGDDQLPMTKDVTWQPLVTIAQTGPQQVRITVTQTVSPPGAMMMVRLIPEHDLSLGDFSLPATASVFARTIDISQPVPPLYAQIYVSETVAAPQTRRELVVDRGTGGSGAFGPARMYGGALVQSSDGNALFENDEPIVLGPGESIAWQSMPGTPPLPVAKVSSGQSHRLDAYPAGFVLSGTVSLQFEQSFSAQASALNGEEPVAPSVWFWNGQQWTELPTTIRTPTNATDGVHLASSTSQGIGVYVVLTDAPPDRVIYLPMVAR